MENMVTKHRVPNVNDRVYFHFLHAFSDGVGGQYVGPDGQLQSMGLFNGKMEMRCRSARVIRIADVVEDRAERLGDVFLDLKVEFHDTDRILLPRGVVGRMETVLFSVCSNRGGIDYRVGEQGDAWPVNETWTYEPKGNLT